MQKTFEQFNFDVIPLRNTKASKPAIIKLVKDLSDYLLNYDGDKSNSSTDGDIKATVFVFCGHGTSHYRVQANDGRHFSLKDIVEPLVNPPDTQGQVCHEIPKIFLIDACRGNLTDSRIDLTTIRGNFRMDYATTQGSTAAEGFWMKRVACELRDHDNTYQNVIIKVNKKACEDIGGSDN